VAPPKRERHALDGDEESGASFKTKRCGKQTSITAGTIFEKTRLPLLTWFRAIWMLTSSKSGVSAKELERELGISYESAC
jgi:hypothetical protein